VPFLNNQKRRLKMSVEENKAIIRRWVEGLNKHDTSIVDQLISDDYVFHGPGGQEVKGPESFKQLAVASLAGLPDAHYAIDDMVAEGDKVSVRYTMTATHKGEYRGIPPTGKRITVTSAFFYRLAGGKIVEALPYSDSLTLYQQLGVTPPMGQA
jgi:steroid delta-isomerase-like uncharacterized protein